MSSEDKGSRPTGPWILVVVLLAPAVVLPLLVGIYDRTEPTLFDFPFYFWFQFALIILATFLTSLAFAVSQRADRASRVARGLPPTPGGDDKGEER